MPPNFADRMLDAVAAKGTPLVVAVDPVPQHLPAALRPADAGDDAAAVAALRDFASRLIHTIAPLVPTIKINIAYFEPFGAPGLSLYFDLVRLARDAGLIVIGDIKRGDVAHTAQRYADAHLVDRPDRPAPDAVTVSAYFGDDGVRPFFDAADRSGKGVFVLVRTSNPSAAALQDAVLADGRKVHERVAGQVAAWAGEMGRIGERGYSSVGAVAATRDPADAARLRSLLPRCLLLVPGYGAQGATAADLRPYFDAAGRGALIVAGRTILQAHERDEYRKLYDDDWPACAAHACRDAVADLARVARA